MFRKFIQDFIGVTILLAACLIGGVILNEMRSPPLPVFYSPSVTGPATLQPGLDLDEMKKLSTNSAAVILDARPASLYRAGHIPSALNLPRDDFDKRYSALQPTLQSHRHQPIVVYCSGPHCPDSQVVAVALQKLGYPQVRIFVGGWSEWQSANLPEVKQ